MGRLKRGDPRFHALLEEIARLHDKKQEDYGSDHDPFANVRASQEWGVSPWVGAGVRLNDKVHRLQQFAQRGELANESAEDSMMDIAVYALIMLVLYREEAAEEALYQHEEGPASRGADTPTVEDAVRAHLRARIVDETEEDIAGVIA